MPTALLSVSDKTGLANFARQLSLLGWELLASGGTAAVLREAGLQVRDVADYTGSPEILSGRVKTLHPAVHGGILARNSIADAVDLERIGATPIDLVVVNLYPFQQTVEREGATLADAIENIDIGGVALIRAAAKNYERVTIITDPQDYAPILEELRSAGASTLETRQKMAVKAFQHTSGYDDAIQAYLSRIANGENENSASINLTLYPVSQLRYGENPHQQAELFSYLPGVGPLGGEVLQGKALSYNNILDLDAAWRAAVMYARPAVVIVKHLSPCGIACGESLVEAFPAALASDPVSAFGGVIAVNRLFDGAIARSLGDLFVECIAAPGFSSEALEVLSSRKNLRLVQMPDQVISPAYELRSVNRGVLRQSIDLGDPPGKTWQVVSQRQPTEAELRALQFAWIACQHVKSNSIVFAQNEATVGIGGGQPNRVDCVRIAARRAGEKARGAVMASDAFFPFPDSVEEAARAGITAIVEPGGSLHDADAIAAADAAGMAMVFTGARHFRH